MKLRMIWIWTCIALLNFSAFSQQSIQQATHLLDAGNDGEAKVILLEVVKHEPENAKAHQLLGDAFRHEGDAMAAEREYRHAFDLGIRDSKLISSLATVEKWSHHFSEARMSYRRELEAAPTEREAKDELDDLKYQRGLSLFASYGGWETDSTTKGWQANVFYGGLDRIDPYAGASYANKYFYTRRSYYAKAYGFLSPTFYAKFNFQQDTYNYPVAITPVPDANAYLRVPSYEFEMSEEFGHHLRATASYEYFRPSFFFEPARHANNHKVSGDVEYHTAWKPLTLKIQAAGLRDPDPARTVVDKTNHLVNPVYGTQLLVGGGVRFSLPRLDAALLVLPNRDLDRSTDYSFLSAFEIPFAGKIKLRTGHVYDHYSRQSAFSGQIAQVFNVGASWKVARWLELGAGGKAVRRPIRNDQAVYLTTNFRLPIR